MVISECFYEQTFEHNLAPGISLDRGYNEKAWPLPFRNLGRVMKGNRPVSQTRLQHEEGYNRGKQRWGETQKKEDT